MRSGIGWLGELSSEVTSSGYPGAPAPPTAAAVRERGALGCATQRGTPVKLISAAVALVIVPLSLYESR